MSTELNSLTSNKDFSEVINTTNTGLKISSPTPASEEVQANAYKNAQTNENKQEDEVKESVDKQSSGKIIEEVDKSGKKRYLVDPDLLIGYTRRTII